MARKEGGGAKSNGASAPNGAPPVRHDEYASGYDFLLINSDMEDALFNDVLASGVVEPKNRKLVLILVTLGGSANVAYKLGRLFQTIYDEVIAFIPSVCKSAGTLMVCAANRLVVSAFGELGPLDVQQLRRDEVIGRRSGLTTRSALEDLKSHTFELFDHLLFEVLKRGGGAISFRTAADLAAATAANIMTPIYSQVNPEALGQDFRDLNVAMRYCERLSSRHGNLLQGAIERLVYQYPSHDFVIDLEEAKEIFRSVELPSPTLLALMQAHASEMLVRKVWNQRVIKILTPAVKPASIDASQTNHDSTEKPRENSNGDDSRPATNGDADGAPAAS